MVRGEKPDYIGPPGLLHNILDVKYIGYLIRILSGLERRDRVHITRTTKIIVNFLKDFTGFDRKLSMKPKPNAYGMVCVFPGDVRIGASGQDTNLKQLGIKEGGKAYKEGFWRFTEEEEGNFLESFVNLEDADRELYSPILFENIKILFKIYEDLAGKRRTEKLNILASHRNQEDDMRCLLFEFSLWETYYQRVIEILKNISGSKEQLQGQELTDLLEELQKADKMMYTACNEICKKLIYRKEGIRNVKKDLEIMKASSEGTRAVYIENIIEDIQPKSERRIPLIEKNHLLNITPLYLLLTSILRNFSVNDTTLISDSWYRKEAREKERKFSDYSEEIDAYWSKYGSNENIHHPQFYIDHLKTKLGSDINITPNIEGDLLEACDSNQLDRILQLIDGEPNGLHTQIKAVADNESLLSPFSDVDNNNEVKGTEGDI